MKLVLRRLARLALGALFGLMLLEVGLRVAGYVAARQDAARIAGNEGAIGADGRPSLLCLGACYTAGIGSSAEQSYPAQLERLWGERHPGQPIRVYNGGQRARGVDYFADRIDELLRTYRPDAIVVNVNDRILYRIDDLLDARRRPGMPLWARDLVGGLRVYRLAHLLLAPPTRAGALEEPQESSSEGASLAVPAGERRLAAARARTVQRPDDPAVWRTLGQACADQAELACVISSNRRVLQLVPDEWDAMRRIAVAQALGRSYRDARESFAAARGIAGPARIRRAAREAEERLGHETSRFTGAWTNTLDDLGTYAAIAGDWDTAASWARRLIVEHPGVLQANDLYEFYTAAANASASGNPLPERAPVAKDSLYVKHRSGIDDDARRYGVYGVEGELEGEAEALLHDVLDLNIGRIAHAAQARGVRVVVEDFTATPDQRAVLRTICDAYDLPLVPLQEAFDALPDRQALMHPTLSMRLNADGNRFLAEQVYAVLDAERVFDEAQ